MKINAPRTSAQTNAYPLNVVVVPEMGKRSMSKIIRFRLNFSALTKIRDKPSADDGPTTSAQSVVNAL